MPAGRKYKPVDLDMLERVASVFCTKEDMATILEVSPRTLQRRADCVRAIQKGQAHARRSLRSLQFAQAMNNNTTMLIWLGKQLLGQADRVVSTATMDLTHRRKTPEEVAAEIEEAAAKEAAERGEGKL